MVLVELTSAVALPLLVAVSETTGRTVGVGLVVGVGVGLAVGVGVSVAVGVTIKPERAFWVGVGVTTSPF